MMTSPYPAVTPSTSTSTTTRYRTARRPGQGQGQGQGQYHEDAKRSQINYFCWFGRVVASPGAAVTV